MAEQPPFDLLIIDGDADQAAYCARWLQRENGVRTRVHTSAREALATFARARFDAILCAPQLADTDCWRFLRMVRSGRFGYGATPCFVLCPSAEFASLLPMADEYTMPVDASDEGALLSRLRAICAGRRTTTVLIVEDEVHAAQAAARALEKFYTVEIAGDGETALAAWSERRHALVILDLGLPDISGSHVLERILALDLEQPIIVLTAQDAPERHQELMLSGATQFLSKPIDLHFLADACARALRDRACLANAERLRLDAEAHRELAAHVHAASYRLQRGQTASASAHLRHALHVSRTAPPTDDQWTQLMSEFDAR